LGPGAELLGLAAPGAADGPGSGRALGAGLGIGTGREEPLGCGFGFAGADPLGEGPGAGFGNAGPTLAPEPFEFSDARGAPSPNVAHATANPTTEINERTMSDRLPRRRARVSLRGLGNCAHQAPATGSGGLASAARARRLARCGLRLVMMPSFSSIKITG
jgi:hypothetical protein